MFAATGVTGNLAVCEKRQAGGAGSDNVAPEKKKMHEEFSGAMKTALESWIRSSSSKEIASVLVSRRNGKPASTPCLAAFASSGGCTWIV